MLRRNQDKVWSRIVRPEANEAVLVTECALYFVPCLLSLSKGSLGSLFPLSSLLFTANDQFSELLVELVVNPIKHLPVFVPQLIHPFKLTRWELACDGGLSLLIEVLASLPLVLLSLGPLQLQVVLMGLRAHDIVLVNSGDLTLQELAKFALTGHDLSRSSVVRGSFALLVATVPLLRL